MSIDPPVITKLCYKCNQEKTTDLFKAWNLCKKCANESEKIRKKLKRRQSPGSARVLQPIEILNKEDWTHGVCKVCNIEKDFKTGFNKNDRATCKACQNKQDTKKDNEKYNAFLATGSLVCSKCKSLKNTTDFSKESFLASRRCKECYNSRKQRHCSACQKLNYN